MPRAIIRADDEPWRVARRAAAGGHRTRRTRALELEAAGVKLDESTAPSIDDRMRTQSAPKHQNVQATATDQPQFIITVCLDARASRAVNMTGGDAALDLTAMPAVGSSPEPQVATVGQRSEAKVAGIGTDSRALAARQRAARAGQVSTRAASSLVAEAGTGRLAPGVQAGRPRLPTHPDRCHASVPDDRAGSRQPVVPRT